MYVLSGASDADWSPHPEGMWDDSGDKSAVRYWCVICAFVLLLTTCVVDRCAAALMELCQ